MTEIDKKLGELVTIVKKLRSPAGCEWDKQQTSETLIPYLLEEAYVLLGVSGINNKPLKR